MCPNESANCTVCPIIVVSAILWVAVAVVVAGDGGAAVVLDAAQRSGYQPEKSAIYRLEKSANSKFENLSVLIQPDFLSILNTTNIICSFILHIASCYF